MSDYRSAAEAQFPYLIGENQRDHMAWAKRIIYREERKDLLLLPIQVQFAKMALGLIEQPNKK